MNRYKVSFKNSWGGTGFLIFDCEKLEDAIRRCKRERKKVEIFQVEQIEKRMVEVRNLLSGKPVMIDEKDVGSCCDPSTERYHSM